MAPEINAFEVIVRLAASLAMVVAIILVAAKVLRGRGGLRLGKAQSGPRLDVLDRTSLNRNASVAVVRVGGRGLVVGITDQSVTLLSEAPELIDRYESQHAQESPHLHESLLAHESQHVEAERTAPPVEHTHPRWPEVTGAPEPARMNFFEALREATVRRS